MKFEFNKRYFTISVYAFLVIACSALFFVLINNFSVVMHAFGKLISLIAPFLYAFCIAYILNPIMMWFDSIIRKIDKRKKAEKFYGPISVTLTYVSAILIITLFIMVIGPQLKVSVKTLYYNVYEWMPTAIGWVENIFHDAELTLLLEKQLNDIVTSLGSWILNISSLSLSSIWGGVKSVTGVIFNLLLGFIISVYMLAGKETFIRQIKKIIYTFFPKKKAKPALAMCADANHMFSSFIQGKILDSVIVGIICALGMAILRLPYASLIGVIVGVTNIIPYFGAWFGAIIGGLIILVSSPMQALIFAIFVIILQQFDGNFLGPKILSSTTGISSFWVMFAIIVGGGLFGVVGMFIGVPTFALIFAFIRSYVNRKYVEKTQIEHDMILEEAQHKGTDESVSG